MTTRIKLRRDTAANWTTNNPILALGEPAVENDTRRMKIGDGTTAWNDLVYFQSSSSSDDAFLIVSSGCNTSSSLKYSTDGLSWSPAYNPSPEWSLNGPWDYNSVYEATPGNGRIVYIGYNWNLDSDTLTYGDTATDFPKLCTFTNLPTVDGIAYYNYWNVRYVNNHFIAVGAYYENASITIARPFFAYSSDGITWTYGNIDETYIFTTLVGGQENLAEGLYISDVKHNGSAYVFSTDWDYNYSGMAVGSNPGFFYLTSLSGTMNSASHFSGTFTGDFSGSAVDFGLANIYWNVDHWFGVTSYNWFEGSPSVVFNSSTDPRQGSWVGHRVTPDADGPDPQAVVFGGHPQNDYGSYSIDGVTTVTINNINYDVVFIDNGRVLYTSNQGATWLGSVPSPNFTVIDSVETGTQTIITLGYAESSFFQGSRVEIKFAENSGIPELNGTWWIKTHGTTPGQWKLCTNANLDYFDSSALGSYTSNTYDKATMFASVGDSGNSAVGGGGRVVTILDAGPFSATYTTSDLINWIPSAQTDTFRQGTYPNSVVYGRINNSNSVLSYTSTANELDLNDRETGGYWNFGGPHNDFLKSFGRYNNQITLGENFQVDVGSANAFGGAYMGLQPSGRWWLGDLPGNYSFFFNSYTSFIASTDIADPGYGDVLIGVASSANYDSPQKTWKFLRDGTLAIPGDITSMNTPGWNNTEFAIRGADGDATNYDAQRVVIRGGDGITDGTHKGEGGDIYLWAGTGYSALGGGDIKIDAGYGAGTGSLGGTIKIRAGHSDTGNGGFLYLHSGSSGTGHGGNVHIQAKSGSAGAGHVIIDTNGSDSDNGGSYNEATGGHQWKFDETGKLRLPGPVVGSSLVNTYVDTQLSISLDQTIVRLSSTLISQSPAYYLGDGVEGQIMYIVPAAAVTSDDFTSVDILHARYSNGAGIINETRITWLPFAASNANASACLTIIFAGGYWNLPHNVTD